MSPMPHSAKLMISIVIRTPMTRYEASFLNLFTGQASQRGRVGTTGRMPTTGPPCRQRGSPLDTLASKYEEIMARTRRPLIAGNWKMNGLKADAMALARDVADGVKQAGWT